MFVLFSFPSVHLAPQLSSLYAAPMRCAHLCEGVQRLLGVCSVVRHLVWFEAARARAQRCLLAVLSLTLFAMMHFYPLLLLTRCLLFLRDCFSQARHNTTFVFICILHFHRIISTILTITFGDCARYVHMYTCVKHRVFDDTRLCLRPAASAAHC